MRSPVPHPQSSRRGDSEPALREVGNCSPNAFRQPSMWTVAGAGHQLHAHNAAVFNQLLSSFLARNSSDLEAQGHRTVGRRPVGAQ